MYKDTIYNENFKRDADTRKNLSGNVEFIDFKENFEMQGKEISFHWWDCVSTSLHFHNHYEIFIITNGQTDHVINKKTDKLQKNTMMLVSPSDVHQFKPSFGFSCIHINLALTEGKLAEFLNCLSLNLDDFLNEGNHTVNLSENQLNFFLEKAEEINCIKIEKEQFTYRSLLISEMIIEALAIFYKENKNKNVDSPEWIKTLLQKMHSPESVALSIGDLYKFCNYSPPVVIKYFKKYTNETLISYFSKIKINYACMLLETTQLSILEVCGKVGYDSLSHFNKIFKKLSGKTPKQFKRPFANN